MLYSHGIQPTFAPFATSHSINEYAGINGRDSKSLIGKLPEGMSNGITSEDTSVEGWPNDLILTIMQGESSSYSQSIEVETFV